MYLPLLLDPQIKAELENLTENGTLPPPGVVQTLTENLIATEGGYFVKSLSLTSLLENYHAVFPEEYERERLRLRRRVFPEATDYQPILDTRLRTILFDILPHFSGSGAGAAAGSEPSRSLNIWRLMPQSRRAGQIPGIGCGSGSCPCGR